MATDNTTVDKAYVAANDILDAASQVARVVKTKALTDTIPVADLLSIANALQDVSTAAGTMITNLVAAKKGLPKTT